MEKIAAPYTNNGYRLALLAAIVILVGLLIFRILLIFSYNGEVGGIDNNLVYDVSRSLGGLSPYSNPAAAPYAITLYSPLFYTICTTIGKIIHTNPDEPIQVYQLCRAVCLFFDIATCLLLYRILRKRFEVTNELSWLAVASLASILCFLGYTFSRADSLLLAFYAAVIYILTDRSLSNRLPKIFVLAVASVGCILSKQNGLIVPFLVIGCLFLQELKKAALYYLLFYIVILIAALFTYRSVYPHLYSNTITALQNRIDLHWFYTEIFKRSMNSLWILPLLTGLIIAIRIWIRPASKEDKGLSFIFLVQLLFSLATSLKWGSTAGYFNESFLLSFIIIAGKSVFNKQAVTLCLILIALFFVHTLAQGCLFFIQHRSAKKILYEQQKEVRNYLQPKLQGHSILNMANANGDFFKTFFYKEIAVPNMDMVDCCELPDHTFDYSAMKKDIRTGRVNYIITQEGDTLTSIWGIPLNNFHTDTTINGYALYQFAQ